MERVRKDLTLGALAVLERIFDDDRDRIEKVLVVDDEYELDLHVHARVGGCWYLVELPRWLLERYSLPLPPA